MFGAISLSCWQEEVSQHKLSDLQSPINTTGALSWIDVTMVYMLVKMVMLMFI